MFNFNILPPEEKKHIENYHRIKLVIVWGNSILATIFFTALLLLPSYLLLALQKNEILRNLKITEENSFVKRIEEIRLSTAALQKNAEAVTKIGETSGFFSEVLSDLIKIIPQGIVASSIRFDSESSELAFDGTAKTRSALITLEQALKNNPRAKDVFIPLTSLVLNEDIPFNLKIKIAK